MDTVVLQSFRTHDVPPWLARCMASVQAWALQEGWGYEFLDDRFLVLAPDWARRRCEGNLYALTDLCRLQWIRDRLDAGCRRVIWSDADLLVFAPSRLDLRTAHGHGLAHEVFVHLRADGTMTSQEGLSNALMVFEQSDDVLDAYLTAGLQRLAALPPGVTPRTALGPQSAETVLRKPGRA